MVELFASGRIVDLILILVALEALALVGWRWFSGRGPSLVLLLCNLASGAALMAAVRAALTDAHWTIVAGFMLASLVAHLTELRLRFRDDGVGALGRRDAPQSPGTSAQSAAFTGRS